MTGPGPHDEDLQYRLDRATAAALSAYRDTTRLIRLLSVLGQPADPQELVEQTLTVLSEVFFAEVTLVAHLVGTRLVVTGACGLPEDDPAFRDGWPAVGNAAHALRTAEVVARNGRLDPADEPGSVAKLGIRSAAWIPLSTGESSDNLLILLRRSPDAFTPSDRQVLSSVASRLRLAVEERARSAVIEQLARYGHRLARHLELEPLLDEAAGLLHGLVDADQVWVVSVEGQVDGENPGPGSGPGSGDGARAQLRAHRGLVGPDLTGWPRPLGPLEPGELEHPVVRPRPYPPPDRAGGTGEPGPTAGTLAAPAPGAVLQVPVLQNGSLAAMLFAARERPRPFARDAPETTAIFANYLAVAMVNAELYRTLRTRATQDPLTGLANRSLVGQRLDDALARVAAGSAPATDRQQVGVLFCDLDRFKEVNDLLGHEAGDELLQQVADRLRRCIRPSDLLARFGGDEFVVVVEGVRDLAEVAEVGRRLSRELDHELVVRGERVPVSVSIGGVIGRPGESTSSAMLRDADAAMYVAKERGPGQVEVFDEVASHRARDRLDLRAELAHALDRDQLRLVYQPIVTLDGGQVVACEALLRWDHPRHGAVPPEVFIPLAEDTGAMVPIGRWVLEQACLQLAAWRCLPGGHELAVSVNLSAGQLRHAQLVEQTLATVHAAGLDPGNVWLEVTENSYLHQDVTSSADALRAAGIHFALDDFGTAYASLSHLGRFPVEILKIDHSFVAGVTSHETERSIVRAILAIAGSLSLTAVAEGVETEPQRAALQELGCQLGQGHLLSPPLAPAEVTRLLAARSAPAQVPVRR